MLAEVIKELELETGITIKVGTKVVLNEVGTNGFPTVESYETGNEWDIDFTNAELKQHFKVI